MNKVFFRAEEIPMPLWAKKADSFIKLVLEMLGHKNWELSVLFCNNRFIKSLNSQYRKKNEATDVLSFPCDEDYEGYEDYEDDAGGGPFLLGDIVIAPQYTAKKFEAATAEDLHEAIRLLIVHGILHLLDYDHADSEESAREMEAHEKEILDDWKELLKTDPLTRAGCRGGCCGK